MCGRNEIIADGNYGASLSTHTVIIKNIFMVES